MTVAQYRVFIDAGGYNEQTYWTANGWQWKQERNRTQQWSWDDAEYNSLNQPVIGVSWYECMAFCAWLTAQLVNELPAGYEIGLPTEAEWEVAAAYAPQTPVHGGSATMQRRLYPWGDSPDPTPEHAIFADDEGNNLGAPAPVGICPTGAAACGALDMAGNVWEYCLNSYQSYPTQSGMLKKEFTTDNYDVPLRGGSWYENKTDIRCRTRDWGRPYGINFGFRILLFPRATP